MMNKNEQAIKKELISAIYKILLLFEDVADQNSNITEQDYLKYLDRLYIRFKGRNNIEIPDTIKGLIILGVDLPKESVKSTVFHMIELIEKGVVDDAFEILQ